MYTESFQRKIEEFIRNCRILGVSKYLNRKGEDFMKEYTGDKIRNVAIVGHGGAGTTSVTEALLYSSGAIS